TGRSRGLKQAFDDGLGGIRYRKHAAVAFGFEFNAPGLKPLDSITRLKPLERSDQLLGAPGKTRCQFAGFETMMRHITTSPSRNSYLGKELRSFLQHRYLGVRRRLRAGDRRKDACRASANHDHSLCFSHFHGDNLMVLIALMGANENSVANPR